MASITQSCNEIPGLGLKGFLGRRFLKLFTTFNRSDMMRTLKFFTIKSSVSESEMLATVVLPRLMTSSIFRSLAVFGLEAGSVVPFLRGGGVMDIRLILWFA